MLISIKIAIFGRIWNYWYYYYYYLNYFIKVKIYKCMININWKQEGILNNI